MISVKPLTRLLISIGLRFTIGWSMAIAGAMTEAGRVSFPSPPVYLLAGLLGLVAAATAFESALIGDANDGRTTQ